nr:hypothetical protein [Tanacetum cinerariifolium]
IVVGDEAVAEYVAAFFQSELGALSLEASVHGADIKYLRSEDLDQVLVALPSLDEQRDIVKTL